MAVLWYTHLFLYQSQFYENEKKRDSNMVLHSSDSNICRLRQEDPWLEGSLRYRETHPKWFQGDLNWNYESYQGSST